MHRQILRRGNVSGVTDDEGTIWQPSRYDVSGEMTFGKPQYNNVYAYNAESYNPNMDTQYLRARYYSQGMADFLTEDSYLGDIADPLSLNQYNYAKSSPLNYKDPSGHSAAAVLDVGMSVAGGVSGLDGPAPGLADLAGAIIAGGTLIYAGGVYVVDKISQAKKVKKTKGCETDTEEEKSKGEKTKGDSDAKLPNQGTVKGDVEGAPSVDARKQGKHVEGHPNYKSGSSTL